ncbi:type I restriction endonuclease subunit R [Mycoplasma sp. 1199]|uniref:type I restriction endonuclease subunit R n=1 Tax=Mycoplasma sp. 1199 TaxID=3108526 RepID=UPI002B1D8473|nr:type I restriction endonuclease subunit R [Mycoplasma sp. 1199]MEA4206060.1 type I restriction endonuclease subunit R [Mycoplasma sp. 1199]
MAKENHAILHTPENTVIAEFDFEKQRQRPTNYQSEADLEKEFINLLTSQGYEYIQIKNSEELKNNFRNQIERLNQVTFTDSEWRHILSEVSGEGKGIKEKTEIIQKNNIIPLKRELSNGESQTKNIRLIDFKNPQSNILQVINQYEADHGKYKNRYDVTILVNGLPLVHVELKRRGVDIREAFNQIERYQSESFWSDEGFFEFIQIFVISNGTETKYYSNTTRDLKTSSNKSGSAVKKSKQSFQYTSYWADGKNRKITDLIDFTRTFFSRHTLLNILTKYCVFDSNKQLLVMRPYQIAATEAIISKIKMMSSLGNWGKKDATGYVWHTTGSGKTLTSFKTAELAKELDDIEKVIFVVDRRDLDFQTINEYNRFEKGSVKGVQSTNILSQVLENETVEDERSKILVTTIQKLSKFIEKTPKSTIYDKKVVFIFDECHRSQFGKMHKRIVNKFKKYFLFGFTGTPIFVENANTTNGQMLTTDIFKDQLHTYTILDGIRDHNVLKFKVDFLNTFKSASGIEDKKIYGIDKKSIKESDKRVAMNVQYILENFDRKTRAKDGYSFSKLVNYDEMVKSKDNTAKELKVDTNLQGFNSIFTVENILMAKKYYLEFKKQLADQHRNLRIATIFTYAPNPDPESGVFEEEDIDIPTNVTYDSTDKEFLAQAMVDYNQMFKTNFSLDGAEGFANYYKDVSLRMKNKDIDILIVVDMFLTGFDSPTLNTLWVDRKLEYHRLIQAFSRTNRILNSVKVCGNIVCFRDLRKEVQDAIALFALNDKEASNTALFRDYNFYLNGETNEKTGVHVKGYIDYVNEIKEKFPLDNLDHRIEYFPESKKKEFAKLFGKILKCKNTLMVFDEFQKDANEIIPDRDLQDYQSYYLNIWNEFKDKEKNDVYKENIINDIVFEIELVQQDEINVEYIIRLIATRFAQKTDTEKVKKEVGKLAQSSTSLRNKKDLILEFIDQYNIQDISKTATENEIEINTWEEWEKFVHQRAGQEINTIINSQNIQAEQAKEYILNSLESGSLKFDGQALDSAIKAPLFPRGANSSNRYETKKKVFSIFQNFFNKFKDILNIKKFKNTLKNDK